MKNINLKELVLFENIADDSLVKTASSLVNLLAFEGRDSIVDSSAADRFYECQRLMLHADKDILINGTMWENYICDLVALSENVFTRSCESDTVNPQYEKMAAGELAVIKRLLSIDWDAVADLFSAKDSCVCSFQTETDSKTLRLKRDDLRDALLSDDPSDMIPNVKKYFYEKCSGLFEKYEVFLWDGQLNGIRNYDSITFDKLIGYERQKKQLIDNVSKFMSGKSSNNVLLHGDKGTGKSSCIKAVLNMFRGDGLRLINVPKNKIFDINHIMESVADRGAHFIIFIDDLSFEDTEIEYKYFKSVLEGGVLVQPRNVLVCVTSNRRNLVKETWKDREGSTSEVHVNDGIQERLSLADRFGLSIAFMAPDKEEFLMIVRGIAAEEGIELDEDYLIREAVKWDMRQTGRSGRSARQFINYISELER